MHVCHLRNAHNRTHELIGSVRTLATARHGSTPLVPLIGTVARIFGKKPSSRTTGADPACVASKCRVVTLEIKQGMLRAKSESSYRDF